MADKGKGCQVNRATRSALLGTYFIRTGNRITVFHPAGYDDEPCPITEVVKDLASESALAVRASKRELNLTFAAKDCQKIVALTITERRWAMATLKGRKS